MPKSKETISGSESGSSSEEEKVKSKPKKQEKKKPQSSSEASEVSESEEETKSRKRAKKGSDDKGANKKAKKETKSNDNDEESWDIGGKKLVTVRPFKGKWYVDIREMYSDSKGEMKPTKKGVFMNQETWKQLKNVMDEVDECLKSKN